MPVNHKTVPEPLPQAVPQVPGVESLEAGTLSEEPLETDPLKAGPLGAEPLEADADVFLEVTGQHSQAMPPQDEEATPPQGTTSPPQSVIVPSQNGATPPNSGPLCENTPPSVLGDTSSLGQRQTSSSTSGQIADHFRKMSSPVETTPPSGRSALLSDYSWEIVSKYSTTSNRLSILQDQSDPNYDLVPLWECLQVCS